MDSRPNRNNKVAFSNLSGAVWMGPKFDPLYFCGGFISYIGYFGTFAGLNIVN